jgi:hypothetical protein
MNSLTMNDHELTIRSSSTGHALPAYVRGIPRSTWQAALGRRSRRPNGKQI